MPEPGPSPDSHASFRARPKVVSLADLTTLRMGGVPHRLVEPATEAALVRAVAEADLAGRPLLVLGGGSNVVCGQDLSDLVVVRPDWASLQVMSDAAGQVRVEASAGLPLDTLVTKAVASGWSGFEALSGIPGTVGGTVVQNVGAYGHEVSELITAVRAYDRARREVVTLTADKLAFGYRASALKGSLQERGGFTPRWVVLAVVFQARRDPLSAPVAYGQLAQALGVELGATAPLAKVRQAVLNLRRTKGMVLDPADHDTWSVGSFFTNPVLCAEHAAALPPGAPQFPAGTAPAGYAVVKTSAAWLMEQAGVAKGAGLAPGPDGVLTLAPAVLNERVRATTSTKHVLALTNRGGATADDIMALAGAIVRQVHQAFQVSLTPEPTLVNTALPAG